MNTVSNSVERLSVTEPNLSQIEQIPIKFHNQN